MFYCDPCADEHGYPKTMSKSHGQCEICGKGAVCNDKPSKDLPRSKMTREKSPASGCRCYNDGQYGRVHRERCPVHGPPKPEPQPPPGLLEAAEDFERDGLIEIIRENGKPVSVKILDHEGLERTMKELANG